MAQKTWNRWHSDGWVLTVTREDDGQHYYSATREGQVVSEPKPAGTLPQAQQKAEEIVRATEHRCIGRCSYWTPDQPEE